jgi:hypothetical protein
MRPQKTIAHLDELKRLGFTDDAFSRLHHFRDAVRPETIKGHRTYCLKTTLFQDDGNNVRVSERLELLLECYKRYHTGKPERFPRLADAVYTLIPPLSE